MLQCPKQSARSYARALLRCYEETKMRIKQLKIEGFRSLKNVTWEPGDLNILIGPNGTGKSNLLLFLELMAVTVKGDLSKYIQSQGGIDNIVWDRQAREIFYALTCTDEPPAPNHYELRLALSGSMNYYQITHELLVGKPNAEEESIAFIKRGLRTAQMRGFHTDKLRILRNEKIKMGETLLSD